MELLGNIRDSVVNAFSTTSPTTALSKSEVLGLEEGERSRRLAQVSQAKLDKQNAASVSTLIRSQSFPVFRGNISRGYKRVTTKFEEEERRRRLTNKSESSLRRSNANKTARMVQSLGWPFYQQNHTGAEYICMDATKLLEEEERQWRTTDSYWTPTARHNAATVANILRWNNFQKNPASGFKRHVKFLEEKERRDRVNADVMNNSMQNAYNESRLIKQMGPPFYTQEAPLAKRDFSQVTELEEAERTRRMQTGPGERQLARELAGLIGSTSANKESELEETERGRRIADLGQQKLAKENARQVALMVRESSSNKLGSAGPMWLGISRNSMKALEEIERTRRVRDVQGQRLAQEHAKTLSNLMIGRLIAPAKPSSHVLEEEERQSRILNRAQQQVAVKNARRVSGLIARHMLMSSGSKSFALALEESERSRRLQDNDQQSLAKDNARKVSSLVSSLNVAPGHQSAPIAPVSAPIAPVAAPIAPVAAPIAPVAAPIAPVAAPIAPVAAPVFTAPTYVSPISVLPTTEQATYGPITSMGPLTKAPVQAAPTALPQSFQRSSGEFRRSESPLVAAAPVTRSVSATQLAQSPSIQPLVLPTTSAPVPVAPLASTIPRQPSFTTVPADSAATSVAALGEKERKRLLKEAEKHNKKSDSNVRKAEQSMLKAEKLHQKGRDDKAQKLESKAEKLMQEAEYERRWASGIQGELGHNTPAPASM